jgi:hypothetical protein
MTISLKIEIIKVFKLEFELSSDNNNNNKKKKEEDVKKEPDSKPTVSK